MFRFPTQLRRKPLSFAGKVLRRHSLDHTIVFGAPEQDPGRTRLRGLTGEDQTEESTSNGGNLPGRHPKGSIRLSPSSIRPSIGTKNPIPEEMDHREIAVRVPVCTENLIPIDCVTESPNVNGDDRALLPLEFCAELAHGLERVP